MDNNWRRAEKSEKMPRSDEAAAAAKKSPKPKSSAAGKQLAKTFAFLPIDGHGHVNAMIGLADQLRLLGHRTVFICNDSSSAKHFGHELVLVRGAHDSGAAAAPPYDHRTASEAKRKQEIIMSEEKIFIGDERLNSKWAQMVDLLDLNVNKPECAVKSLAHNYGLLRLTIEAEIIPLDERIETILIDLRPDLVVVDQLTPIPAIHRLCAGSASASAASGSGIGIGNGSSSINLGSGAAASAGRRAGSSGGENVAAESKQQQEQLAKMDAKSQQKRHQLRWISLCSCNPMPLYHDHSLAAGEHQFPPPLMGLSARMDSGVELEVEQLRYERCLSSSGILGALARLASMAQLGHGGGGGGASLSEQDFRRFCRNESPWLNLYMYPAALDYEGERCGRAHLPRDRYHRLDCLIRAPKELSRDEQASLRQLEDWRDELLLQEQREKATARRGEEPSNGRPRKTTIVYVSLGTTMSLNLRLMEALLGQVFACLEASAHYRFVVSLGARAHLLSSSCSSSYCSSEASSVGEQLERWRRAGRLLAGAWWPQPELMRRKLIDAAVVHGGNNTICELVHFGVATLVVVPAFHDQLDNARRVADLAMGVALPATELLERGPSDASLLRRALDEAAELSHKQRQSAATAATPHGQQRDAQYCARLLEAKLASWQSD